jgi:hypothetical protein
MRRSFIVVCVFFMIMIVQAQSEPEGKEPQEIFGTVTDFFGVPWQGVKLRLRSKQLVYKSSSPNSVKIEKETATDKDGKYAFKDLPEDAYEVTLLRTGSGTVEETKETGIIFNGQQKRLDFGVEVGAISECQYIVAGVVTNDLGNPIEGAKVSAFNAFNQRRILSATTNKTGAYDIRICSLGQYVVFANTPKYHVLTTTVLLENVNDLKRTDFKLKPISQALLNWRK